MSSPPTGALFYDARAKPLSTTGAIQPGAYYQFYTTGTTTLANVYADGALTTPLSQTPGTGGTTAAGDGRLVPIYLNPTVIYRYQLYSAGGILLEDVDPYIPAPASANYAVLSVDKVAFFPVINFGTSGSINQTISSAVYSQIGHVVYFNFSITWTTISSPTGGVTISGMPAMPAAGAGLATNIAFPNMINFSGGVLSFVLPPGTTTGFMFVIGSSGTNSALQGSAFSANGQLLIEGTYHV
jgi:hypothetical protein